MLLKLLFRADQTVGRVELQAMTHSNPQIIEIGIIADIRATNGVGSRFRRCPCRVISISFMTDLTDKKCRPMN